MEPQISCPQCLPQLIKGLLQLQHLLLSADDESRRLPDINFLLKLTIEEGGFHIHVMDPPSLVRLHSESQSHRLHPCHRSECFFVVDPLFLHELLGDKSCLVLDDVPMFIFLHLEHPFESDRSVTGQKVNDAPHVVLFN
jgi:hypothetical protein